MKNKSMVISAVFNNRRSRDQIEDPSHWRNFQLSCLDFWEPMENVDSGERQFWI